MDLLMITGRGGNRRQRAETSRPVTFKSFNTFFMGTKIADGTLRYGVKQALPHPVRTACMDIVRKNK